MIKCIDNRKCLYFGTLAIKAALVEAVSSGIQVMNCLIKKPHHLAHGKWQLR